MSRNKKVRKKSNNVARVNEIVNKFAIKLIDNLFLSYTSVGKVVTIEGTRDIDPECPNLLTERVVTRAQELLVQRPREWTYWLVIFHTVKGEASYASSVEHYKGINSVQLDVCIKDKIITLGGSLVDGVDINLHHFAWICFPKHVTRNEIHVNEEEWIDAITEDHDMLEGKALRFDLVPVVDASELKE